MTDLYKKEYEIIGRRLVYYMPKEVDQHVAQNLCKELDMLIEAFSVGVLELDFAQTEFMDSAGIGVVLGRSKTMQFREGSIEVSHLRERLMRIFKTTGLQRVVEIKEEE